MTTMVLPTLQPASTRNGTIIASNRRMDQASVAPDRFAASPPHTVAIATTQHAGEILSVLARHPSFKLQALVTERTRPTAGGGQLRPCEAKIVAEELGVPTIEVPTLNGPSIIETLTSLRHDLVVWLGLPATIPHSAVWSNQHLAIHFSLLPHYRGPAPVARAVLDGVPYTGVSFVALSGTLGTCPILSQHAVEVRSHETTGDLQDRLAHIAARELPRIARDFLAGRLCHPEVAEHHGPSPMPPGTVLGLDSKGHALLVQAGRGDSRLRLERVGHLGGRLLFPDEFCQMHGVAAGDRMLSGYPITNWGLGGRTDCGDIRQAL